MNKFALFASILMAFLLTVNQASACSIDGRPYFNIIAPELENCYFVSFNEDVPPGVDINEFIKNRTRTNNCDNLALNAEEQEMVRNAVNQFNKEYLGLGSVNFEKQSESEYLDFLEQARSINADQCDCEEFDNITRQGEWTVYRTPMVCGIDGTCAVIPPEGCLNRITQDLIRGRNPLLAGLLFIVLPIAVIIGLAYLVIRHRKK
jgi:hypothetical protein